MYLMICFMYMMFPETWIDLEILDINIGGNLMARYTFIIFLGPFNVYRWAISTVKSLWFLYDWWRQGSSIVTSYNVSTNGSIPHGKDRWLGTTPISLGSSWPLTKSHRTWEWLAIYYSVVFFFRKNPGWWKIWWNPSGRLFASLPSSLWKNPSDSFCQGDLIWFNLR